METLITIAVIGLVLYALFKRVGKALSQGIQEGSKAQMRQLVNRKDLNPEQRARIQAMLDKLDGKPATASTTQAARPLQPAQPPRQSRAVSPAFQSQVELPASYANRYANAESHPALHGSLEDELLHQTSYGSIETAGGYDTIQTASTRPLTAIQEGEGMSLLGTDLESAKETKAEDIIKHAKVAQRVRGVLTDPKSLRDTLIAAEVLKRPEW